MSTSQRAKHDYDASADRFEGWKATPGGMLESELVKIGVGDVSGLTILDLGGGTGMHGRELLELGASIVDVVDISPKMLEVGRDIAKSQGLHDRIQFLEADCSKPLPTHLPLRRRPPEGHYDLVLAMGPFSHMGNLENMEGLFRNIVDHLKPGGRLLGIREGLPYDVPLASEKYGISFTKGETIPGVGDKTTVTLLLSQPVELECSPLEIIYSGSTEMFDRFGLLDVQMIPFAETETVRKDPEFWKDFLEKPYYVVFTATKKPN